MDVEADSGEFRRVAALSCMLPTDGLHRLPSQVRVDIGARSHQGAVRLSNEDHYLVLRLRRHQDTVITSLPRGDLPGRVDECGYAMLVADGLGEAGAGAAASRVALSALAHLAIHYGHWSLRVDPVVAAELKERGLWFYQQSNSAAERTRTLPALSGMANAVTAAYTAGVDLFVAHAGHSGAYLFRDGALTLITRDSDGMAVDDRGTRDLQHILTEAIGRGPGDPLVDVNHLQVLDGDAVLLCTNGLTDVLSEDRMCDVLTFRRSSAEQCRLLVDLALRAGTNDNVTAVLAQYAIPRTKSG